MFLTCPSFTNPASFFRTPTPCWTSDQTTWGHPGPRGCWNHSGSPVLGPSATPYLCLPAETPGRVGRVFPFSCLLAGVVLLPVACHF